ncbi:Ribosomal protein S12 methylthiotransferase RimO [Planctomycetes bacterium Poly30]|uniref:Ribosomal protein S12 methylthiotransferase RimO n=1 Tax=Saltatorellus ferox TaxID=2528018 RepID=A0A518EQF2_9BACT|nr:Ribosomal protein S12 methylthiotransferase RimO [Planctomycetes bacterium Poly30]
MIQRSDDKTQAGEPRQIPEGAAEFPVLLAFPPQGHWTQPHLALPCLKAWLHQSGYGAVEQMDLSVEAFDHFLSPASLKAARDRVQERIPLASFEADELDFESMRAWRAAAESTVSAEALIAGIDEAKRVLRGQDTPIKAERGFWNPDRYIPATRTLYHGLRLISAAHYPSELTPHNFTMAYSNERSEEVLAATLDEEQNPFIAFYRDVILPRIMEQRPRVLGLSVLYGSQLIPALTLGRMVKAALPECHMTMGGGFLAYIGEKVMSVPGMAECMDSMIFHEGERPLTMLCDALLRGESDLGEIGSLAWWDRRESGTPKSRRNTPAHPIKLDAAPPPDLDGLPLDKYFSPDLVIPYDVNRGCYYGECTFCTLPTVIGPGYRTRKAETIAEHVAILRDRYGSTHFNFITDCMPPGMIQDLPERLIETKAGITWWADARIEPKAYNDEGAKRLYESGCRKLLFGFETSVKRLLKLMMKGQSLKSVVEVARSCTQADISVTFYAMVGFPTETREEARETLRFLEEHRDIVREVSLQTFHIDEVAKTYKQPDEFGIRVLEADGDLALYHDYVCESGMTQEEAAEMFEEMMASFRRNLPIFSGDNIFYFMQKSHYFLHLANGTTPDQFVERCIDRTNSRTARGAEDGLSVSPGLASVPLAFSHSDAVRTMGDPLARAARPDFLTGRFVKDAEAVAAERLKPLPPTDRVLLYDPENGEFIEVRPDGLKVLKALEAAGSLGALLERSRDRGASEEALEKVRTFAAELHRLGALRVENETDYAAVR